METFNFERNVSKSKYRQIINSYFYHNVPRNATPFGVPYNLSSTLHMGSESEYPYSPWSQEEAPPDNLEEIPAKERIHSLTLIIALAVIITGVLSLTGLALYIGIFGKVTPSALLTFSCSAKVISGDKFSFNVDLQEKAQRYKQQFEALYSNSFLGPAFVSCAVYKFGIETNTIYFKLRFNRDKLAGNVAKLEKQVKEIFTIDSVSTHPVFDNVQYDPRHVVMNLFQDYDDIWLTETEKESLSSTGRTGKLLSKGRGSYKVTNRGSDTIVSQGTASVKRKRKTFSKGSSLYLIAEAASIPFKLATVEIITKPTSSSRTPTIISAVAAAATIPTTEPASNVEKPQIEDPWIPIFSKPMSVSIPQKSTSPAESSQLIFISFANSGLTIKSEDFNRPPTPVNEISTTTEAPGTVSPTSDKGSVKVPVTTEKTKWTTSAEIEGTKPFKPGVVGQAEVEVVDLDYDYEAAEATEMMTLLSAKPNSEIRNKAQKSVELDKNHQETHEKPKPSVASTTTKNLKTDFERSLKGMLANHSFLLTVNITVSNTSNRLPPEENKRFTEIGKLTRNITVTPRPQNISTNTISPLAFGGSVLNKPLRKVAVFQTVANFTVIGKPNPLLSECPKSWIMCDNGTCLSETKRCNYYTNCLDGSDEENCTCAEYLKTKLLDSKICDGVVDCWDYSDEVNCEWCQVGYYICSHAKKCIETKKVCDGVKDCPNGDDEKECVTIAPDVKSADELRYYPEGILMIRKQGEWGKFCVDDFDNIAYESFMSWQISDLGRTVCRSMTYLDMKSLAKFEDTSSDYVIYYKIVYSMDFNIRSRLQFERTNCTNRRIINIKCGALECGTRPNIIKHFARVVGGGNAVLGAWPWQAALYKEGGFQCGAILLSDKWLVSAGHCFYRSQQDYWVARLGVLRRSANLPSPYEQLRKVTRVIVHPDYMESGFVNDISLVQLETPVTFTDYVRPICLPPTQVTPHDGELCTVVGWGQLHEVGRVYPDTLQEVQVPYISTTECRKKTLFLSLYRITDNMFCAGYDRGGRDACLGDSGGPLMCPEGNGRWTLHGITSNGYGCARANRPGVYTKVASFIPWIKFYLDHEIYNPESLTIKNNCTGLRCPYGECLPKSRVCNGYAECPDGSDEKNCDKAAFN